MNEEKKINDDFEMIDFEEATDDNIETLDETSNNSEEIKGTIFDNNSTQNQDTEGTVIDVNRLFDVNEKEEQIAEEEIKKEETKNILVKENSNLSKNIYENKEFEDIKVIE